MRSLNSRLALTYLLIVFVALTAVNLLVLGAIEALSLRQREVAALTAANIGVNAVEPFYRPGRPALGDDPGLAEAVREYARQSGSRVLALGLGGRVVADSVVLGGLAGRSLTHPEVAEALAGRAASGRRYLQDSGWVLYTVAPVLESKQPVGAIFLSTSLDDMYAGLGSVARTMLVMSGIALLVATAAGLAVARTITRPIARLTQAVGRMGRGDLGQRVAVRGRDEVATLTRTFNQMAEALDDEDERRREFLADVAHELQTPVSAIRAMAEPLAAPSGDYDLATHKELAREMERQAERLGRLVGDLLELARLESLKVSLIMEDVDLGGLLAGVTRSLGRQAEAAGVRLETGNLPSARVTGDGVRLEEVFLNLVGNGIKYAGPGRAVRVDLEVSGPEVVARVSDDGPGIPAEHLPHVFERFYRVERSRSRQAGGTGLGLAIVKRIADLHGGSVSARARDGGGTVFEVRLPAADRRPRAAGERGVSE